MPKHPLAEVFGFPADNVSAEATRYRENKLCPFNNKVPNCTKDKADNPLGVCSVFDGNAIAITCPIRFREEWLVAEDAARFFFPTGTSWTSVTEVPLKDKHDKVAGNVDIVLVSYDSAGKVTDFGALEVQAVYISGNIRRPFEHYMEAPADRTTVDWTGEANYPRPDYLSSTRKRLAPQLMYKGGILKAWGKKTAVALDRSLYRTLPRLRRVAPEKADVAWLVYELRLNDTLSRYVLARRDTIYTSFDQSLKKITKPVVGDELGFVSTLQRKLDEMLESENPPDAPAMDVNL